MWMTCARCGLTGDAINFALALKADGYREWLCLDCDARSNNAKEKEEKERKEKEENERSLFFNYEHLKKNCPEPPQKFASGKVVYSDTDSVITSEEQWGKVVLAVNSAYGKLARLQALDIRASQISDECGRLNSENRELLAENARLRRENDALRAKGKKR